MHVLDLAAILVGRREVEAACVIRKQYDRIQELERVLRDLNRELHRVTQTNIYLRQELGGCK
ncbi:hypothetical protein Roomu2_00143 [Pseudomonas phage vB_PpuM-Roomu-2]|uniref:Uncharacterized protein n=1 Tax=Pseudomonas phage vB_PpuM-Roomu-2 TaxID=3132621 RepID=A0AAX4MYN5_9CAUD